MTPVQKHKVLIRLGFNKTRLRHAALVAIVLAVTIVVPTALLPALVPIAPSGLSTLYRDRGRMVNWRKSEGIVLRRIDVVAEDQPSIAFAENKGRFVINDPLQLPVRAIPEWVIHKPGRVTESMYGYGCPWTVLRGTAEDPPAPPASRSDSPLLSRIAFLEVYWPGAFGGIAFWFIVMFIVFHSIYIIRIYRRTVKKICVECRYSLAGISVAKCPECGRIINN